MGRQEQRRLRLLTEVMDGRLSLSAACEALRLSERQGRRLLAGLRRDGVQSLIHGNRGRAPVNRLSDETRERILRLAVGKYRDFNDCHFQELLLEREQIQISRESLRQLLRANGRKSKRRRRSPKHRHRRERRAARGELIQWDGSKHHWLGEDLPQMVLMAAVDDADTSAVAACFQPTESGLGYFRLLEQILETEGIPVAIYQDMHGSLRRNDGHWSLEEELAGEQKPTQLGQILEDLGIHPIFARSAQGKGRIERFFAVAQDRLVAELKLEGIKTIEQANEYLAGWMAGYNRRFSKTPRSRESMYCPIEPAQLRQALSFRYERTVKRDNVVELGDLTIQIPPGPKGRTYAKQRVRIRQHADGAWTVSTGGDVIADHPPTQLATPNSIRTKASGGGRVRKVKETIEVYFIPEANQLPEELARL